MLEENKRHAAPARPHWQAIGPVQSATAREVPIPNVPRQLHFAVSGQRAKRTLNHRQLRIDVANSAQSSLRDTLYAEQT
jgi:hypothetical protein